MRSDRAREVAGAFSELLASSVSPAEQPGFPHMESMCHEGERCGLGSLAGEITVLLFPQAVVKSTSNSKE